MNEQEFNDKFEEIKNILQQAEGLFEQLKEIKEEAVNKRGQIQRWYTNTENVQGETNALKERATQIVDEIQNKKEDAENKITEIAQYYSKFTDKRSKLEDEETGLEAIFKEAKALKGKISEVSEKAEKLHLDINNRLEKVKEIQVAAEELKNKISGYEKESAGLKETISEHLNLITSSHLQSNFQDREKKLIWAAAVWGVVTVAGLVFLGWFYYELFQTLATADQFSPVDIGKIVFSVPLIFGLVWAAKNYSQERKLLEKYGYKAVISTSLKSYIRLLKDEFPESKEERLELTVDTLGKIFNEPYEDNTEEETEFSLWNTIKARIFSKNGKKEKEKDKKDSNIEKST